jgi:hypothetical protein
MGPFCSKKTAWTIVVCTTLLVIVLVVLRPSISVHREFDYALPESKVYFLTFHGADATALRAALEESPEDVRARDLLGATPLHIAVSHGRIDLVRVLLEYGAPVNARTPDGTVPIEPAIHNGDREIVQLLVEAGADLDVHAYHDLTVREAIEEHMPDIVTLGLERDRQNMGEFQQSNTD